MQTPTDPEPLSRPGSKHICRRQHSGEHQTSVTSADVKVAHDRPRTVVLALRVFSKLPGGPV
jgi:hypothetical protein